MENKESNENRESKMTLKKAMIAFGCSLGTILVLVLTGANIMLALLAAMIVLTAIGLMYGYRWETIENAAVEGGKSVMVATLVMIMVGILVGLWIISGTIPALLYYGLKLINPYILLPFTMVICMLTALATGTSWGSANTMGIAMIGVGVSLGLPLPMVAGAIVSGAIVGDKLSPLSDTNLLASASTETNLIDHIIGMMYTTVPIFLVSMVVYGIMGAKYAGMNANYDSVNQILEGLENGFRINLWMLIPMLVVLGLSVLRLPTLAAMGIGIVVSIIWPILFQGSSYAEVMDVAINGYISHTGMESLDNLLSRGGVLSMATVVLTALMSGVFSRMLNELEVMSTIISHLMRFIHSARALIYASLATTFGLLISGGQYTALTLPGAAFKKAYDDFDVNSSVLSRSMCDVGTMVECIIPWSVSGIYYSSVLGVAVTAYAPFALIALLSPVIAIFNAATGLGVLYKDDPVKYKPFWFRGRHVPSKENEGGNL